MKFCKKQNILFIDTHKASYQNYASVALCLMVSFLLGTPLDPKLLYLQKERH